MKVDNFADYGSDRHLQKKKKIIFEIYAKVDVEEKKLFNT